MKKNLFVIVAILLVASFALTACGGGATPVPPTQAPAAAAPKATEAPAATVAPTARSP